VTEKSDKAANTAAKTAKTGENNVLENREEKAREEKINLKAEKLQDFLAEAKVGFFQAEATGDNFNTVIFRTNITVQKQQLPVGVFTDDSIYSLIRIRILPAMVNAANRNRVFEYLNELNAKYKIFKYYSNDGEAVFLDISLPCLPEYFDPRIVFALLELAVNHLNEIFFDFMRKVWGE
jgi:predicted ATP-grasp superfamily ATP-dependent carboligase